MKAKIVQLEEKKFIGMHWFGKHKEDISSLWCSYMSKAETIPNKTPSKNQFGICYMEGNEPSQEHFHYIACREVSSIETIPESLSSKTLPASKYAVYTHKGLLSTLADTYNKIYCEWLKEDGLEPNYDFNFELYDERFDDNSENSEMDIYVPIK